MEMIKKGVPLKKTGLDWMPEVPEHWEIRKLSYAFKTIGSGSTPESGNVSFYENGTINWVNTGDLNDGILSHCEKKITRKAFEEYSTLKIYPHGTLLIAMYGATIGKVSILNMEACTNQACCALAESEVFLTEYVFYWFLVNKKLLTRLSYGGGQPNISQDTIKNLRVPCPPKDEQDEIVQYIKAKEEKINLFIQKKQQFIELLKEQRQSIITNAITKGVDENINVKNSGVEWLGNVPNHWKIVRLKFLGESFIGLTYSPIDLVDKEEGIFILRSSNIQNGKFTTDDNVFVKKEIPEKLILKKGDILLCSRNGSAELIGKNILIDEESEGNSFGAFMTVFRSDLNYYLYYFFNSNVFKSQTALFATSTINQLTNGILSNLTIAFPENIDEQKRIIEHIKTETATIDTAIAKAEREIELIREYKEAMIAEAVLGKRKLNFEK